MNESHDNTTPSMSSSSSPAPPPTSRPTGTEDNSTFECNICLDAPSDPVITYCGHLFCWPCIFKWLNQQGAHPQCPVCKSGISRDTIIPLYGRGKDREDPRDKPIQEEEEEPEIPNRPRGQRTETPSRSHNNGFGFFQPPGSFGHAQFGNVSFAAGFGGLGLFPALFGIDLWASPPRSPQGQPLTSEEAQQAFLSRVLLMLGTMVIICLLWF